MEACEVGIIISYTGFDENGEIIYFCFNMSSFKLIYFYYDLIYFILDKKNVIFCMAFM